MQLDSRSRWQHSLATTVETSALPSPDRHARLPHARSMACLHKVIVILLSAPIAGCRWVGLCCNVGLNSPQMNWKIAPLIQKSVGQLSGLQDALVAQITGEQTVFTNVVRQRFQSLFSHLMI